MLKLNQFTSCDECMIYEGNNNYSISEHKGNYLLIVQNPETHNMEKYICSSMHTAIEMIELIENCKEV